MTNLLVGFELSSSGSESNVQPVEPQTQSSDNCLKIFYQSWFFVGPLNNRKKTLFPIRKFDFQKTFKTLLLSKLMWSREPINQTKKVHLQVFFLLFYILCSDQAARQ